MPEDAGVAVVVAVGCLTVVGFSGSSSTLAAAKFLFKKTNKFVKKTIKNKILYIFENGTLFVEED